MPLEMFGEFEFTGGSSTTANSYQDSQVCINWYPEVSQAKSAKSVTSLLGCPGLLALTAPAGVTLPTLGTAWATPPASTTLPVRGLWVLPGRTQALAVIGSTAYLVTQQQSSPQAQPTLSMAVIGSLATSTGPVSLRDNGVGGVAVMVDGPYGYYYVYGVGGSATGPVGTFIKITDPAFLGANRVAFIDGWWIFNQPGTQTFYTNAAQYSTAFAGSYFALKDSSTDLLVGVMESKEELWLVGETTTEIWYDAGGQYFPFQRLVGTMLQIGCKAAQSIARLSADGEDGLIWFGRSERGENVIVRTSGFSYKVVSTAGVSDAIAKYTYTADAIAYTYQEDGHEFYVLTFPTADATWVYDASLPPELAWHQRLAWDPYAQSWHRHRSNAYMNFAGMRVVGDFQNGVLYQLTRAAFSDAAWPLRAVRRSPHVWSKSSRQRVFMTSLQVDFAQGVGNQTGLGTVPQAYLRLSRDGGATFGQKYPAPLAQLGDTRTRTLWRRLGVARDFVAEIEVIDPVRRDIVGATLHAMGEETSQ